MDKPELYTLKSKGNLELEVSTLGATIVGLKVPGKKGELRNVVVGLSKASDYLTEAYLEHGLYLGSIIGRHAGRISRGSIEVEGETYALYNENGVHLHGGKEGFDKKIWKVESVVSGDRPAITLSYLSPHLEEGYPGNLKIFVTYAFTADSTLEISYKASSDRTTVLNVTNHAYFNLDGEASILQHKLQLNADAYLELGEDLLPTGKLNQVQDSSYDFRRKKVIGVDGFKGLDDVFVLKEGEKSATISSEKSGIQMKVSTDRPAMVIYTPPAFGGLPFKDGAVFTDFPAICFETQGFPDALNNKDFPSTLLRKVDIFESATRFEFSMI